MPPVCIIFSYVLLFQFVLVLEAHVGLRVGFGAGCVIMSCKRVPSRGTIIQAPHLGFEHKDPIKMQTNNGALP